MFCTGLSSMSASQPIQHSHPSFKVSDIPLSLHLSVIFAFGFDILGVVCFSNFSSHHVNTHCHYGGFIGHGRTEGDVQFDYRFPRK
jgi:hypothetical protein